MESKKCIHCGTTENVGGWGRCRVCMDKEKQAEREYFSNEYEKRVNRAIDKSFKELDNQFKDLVGDKWWSEHGLDKLK